MADGNHFDPLGDPVSRGTNLAPASGFPVRLAWGFYAAMATVAVVWRWLVDDASAWNAPEQALQPLPVRVVAGVGVGLLLVALSRVWTARSAAGARLAAQLSAVLGEVGPVAAWGLALASGLGEELLFRGALQPQVGLLLASLLFGAVHYLPGPGNWVWSVASAGAGLVLGGLFLWTGDLVAPVLAHVVINGLNLGWLGRRAA